MLVRYLIGVSLGAVVTFALFYLMQWLILADKVNLDESGDGRILDFVMVEQEEELQTKNRKPKPPPPPDEPPPDMPDPSFDSDVEAIGVNMGGLGMDANLDISSGGGFSSDGEYLPIVKVAPVYPRRALTRGIEGYVLLEFTVTKTGAVQDPVVIEADPPGIFDRAAMQAALKFKYKPKVVNGEPIDVGGVRNLITFELTE
ncbi:MAG TPA: energy transducer TonB [Pseudomonadales bacterium]|nr:energy transducer TonB [Pseudomonadales bacterium]